MFSVMCPCAPFVESVPVPPEHEKSYVDVSCPGLIGMHYVTHRSHRMKKHKFGLTCSGTLFTETALSPPEHEKCCVDVSRPECNRMHCVTHISHHMQKH
jgi:hypothetical protein